MLNFPIERRSCRIFHRTKSVSSTPRECSRNLPHSFLPAPYTVPTTVSYLLALSSLTTRYLPAYQLHVPNQIGGLSTCERKVLNRKTLRPSQFHPEGCATWHALPPADVIGRTLNRARDSRPSPLHPLFQKRINSLPERYYWTHPIASALRYQPRCTRSSEKFRYDTATFIQDRGQVPFEPQIQRTFSMDKKSNCIVQSNDAPTLRSEI